MQVKNTSRTKHIHKNKHKHKHKHSTLLVPPGPSDRTSSDEDLFASMLTDNVSSFRSNTYPPGYFSCSPPVHIMTLTLHNRVPPATAINHLLDFFHLLSVSNRKNLFVYREKNGHVFYLKLAESKLTKALQMEVFGVDNPSSEITSQLAQSLEMQLSSLAITTISSFLDRNPNLKLTEEVRKRN